jgi:hypothetical protein
VVAINSTTDYTTSSDLETESSANQHLSNESAPRSTFLGNTLQVLSKNASQVDLDTIIGKLLKVKSQDPGTEVRILEDEVSYLCKEARRICISQPSLLELECDITVCRPSKSPLKGLCLKMLYTGG